MSYGEPENVLGRCNARLYIADDYGDNRATIRCQLDPEHEGQHKEEFKRGGKPVLIYWEVDERKEEEQESTTVTRAYGERKKR